MAEFHPTLFVALLGRALPNIMQHESGDDGIEVVYRSAEDIEAALKARNLPPLKCPKFVYIFGNKPQPVIRVCELGTATWEL